MMPLFFIFACVRYPTEDFRVDELSLSYSVLAENLEEATVRVRLSSISDPLSADVILSSEDSLYIEHDGDSYILDEEDSSIFILTDVEYTAKIPYSDTSKPFTLVFDRPTGQYRTDIHLVNDFSVSLQYDELFVVSDEEYIPIHVGWSNINAEADIKVGVINTDCVGHLSESVENTGEANVEIHLYDPVVQVGLFDLLCPVEVSVYASVVGHNNDFGDSYIRGYQRRASYIKVLYKP